MPVVDDPPGHGFASSRIERHVAVLPAKDVDVEAYLPALSR
jgi:hypothetical protein